MDNDRLDRDGNLPLTFATWVYQLHVAGIEPADMDLKARCQAVSAASDRAAGDEAGERLVRRVSELIGADGKPAAVSDLAKRLYGDRVRTDLGTGDREERAHRIRVYQFGRNLPWLARIFERDSGGNVGPSWLLVERFTDQVLAADPNPWNDVDETRRLPVLDFHVLWELDGCPAIAVA